MAHVSYQGDARPPILANGKGGQRKARSVADTRNPAQSQMRRLLDLTRKIGIVQGKQALRIVLALDPDKARRISRQRHQREWPRAPMELDANTSVRALMRKARRHRNLIVGP